MNTAELIDEYLIAMRRMKLDHDVEALKRHSVPMRAIATVCPAPVTITVDRSGELYQPHEAGRAAWVFPVCCIDPENPDAIEAPDPLAVVASGAVIDLLAFSPLAPRRWALRRGVATVVGAIPPQFLDPDAVVVHDDVTDWLRAGCSGIVLLTRSQTEAARVLRQCQAIEVNNASHAADLLRLLQPVTKWPTVRVRTALRSAA